jgi:cell division protein FtsW
VAKKLAFDKALCAAVLLLVGLGLVMVYSASAAIARDSAAGVNPFLVKQALAAMVGLTLMGLVMHLDYRLLRKGWLVYGLLGIALALLVAVLFAPKLNETHRWIFIAGISVQPSEIAKLALVPFLAWQLERKGDRVNQPELLVPALGVTGVLAGLVVLAPHLSAALLLVAACGLLLFLAGLSWRYLAVSAVALLPAAAFAIFSAPYRRERLFTFLDPERDPLGTGFQAVQSLIAIGSGGVLGVGLGNSAQKLHFLPYPHTDYIYSIVGEELGLLGALLVVALFAVLGWRGMRAGALAPDPFGRYLAWGFTGALVLQALLHCSVAVALLPSTGIPMPFMTYGGSALVTALVASGVIANVSQHAG